MKTALLLLLALALFVSQATHASAQHARVAIRQDSAAPTPSESIAPAPESTANTSDPTSASDAPQPTSKDGSSESQDKPSQAPDSSSGASNSSSRASDRASTTKPPASTTLQTITTSVSSTFLPQLTQTPVAPGVDALPLQPVISPGLAVAGVLLLGFGIAYTFIGIRQKWFHIFCAVMYLVALAITVLLVYVVNPPVSPSVQGAYLVAAFVPGVIIAAASLIFKEIVEGLGCLLGGFCFAMWLLCLAPGGLVHSNGGRVGLIVAFSGAFFALSFSHYTRTYGLIGCIAFAGATSIVLGIDCFSRAGLKEFWIYNWDLNALIFPLDTNSYPTTRGIKVESAVIVIIAIFGVMSQMKLWNIIKERRAEREKARMQDEEDREHLEADLGRRIEQTNQQEKARWEEIYDGKMPNSSVSMAGSTMASTYELGANSRSQSVHDLPLSTGNHEIGTSNTNSMEMQDLSGVQAKRDSRERSSIVVGQREVSEGPDAIKTHHRTNTLERLEAAIVEQPSYRNSASEAPTVEPLPFKVPVDSASRSRSNSVTTNGADLFDDSHRVPVATKRASDPRYSQRISRSTMGEELNVPHDDDRASSLAATFDDLTDDEAEGLPKLSRPASPAQVEQPEIVLPKRTRSLSSKDASADQARGSLRVPSDAKLDNRKSMPSFEDLSVMQNGTEDALFAPSTNLADTLKLKTKPSADGESQGSSAARRASLKKEFLPQDQPSVASIYRTNEWAKHQASAEMPSMEDIAPPSEEGVSVDYGKETSAPVDVHALQQTALSGRELRVRSPSQLSSTNPYRNGTVQRSNSQISLQQQQQQQPPQNPSIDIPNTSPTLGQGPLVQRASSQTRLNSMRSGMLSTPLLSQPLIESPIEELPEHEPRVQRTTSQQQMYSHPSSSATLLGRREDMLNARKSSTMLPGSESNTNLPGALNRSQTALSRQSVRQSSAPIARTDSVYSNFNNLAGENGQAAQGDSQSMYQGQLSQQPDADLDDMPLSQRKEMIRRSSLSQVGNGGLQRTDSQYTLGAPVSPVNGGNPHQGVIYDAHAPKRGPSFHAENAQARMANWRSDLQADERVSRTQSILMAQSQDEALNRLREERRARGEAEQRREIERSAQQGALDERMRSGNMLRTHAEVMRKMQRSARAD